MLREVELRIGGTWTITDFPANAGSTVTLRENGLVKSALFRFVSRFITGRLAPWITS